MEKEDEFSRAELLDAAIDFVCCLLSLWNKVNEDLKISKEDIIEQIKNDKYEI